MPHPSWDESYASNQLPWDTGQPEPLLVEFLATSSLQPGPTLEIGAGTGTNAIWMAERGFDVLEPGRIEDICRAERVTKSATRGRKPTW